MADEHLRELERRAVQGDLEAKASLLRERLRIGELDKKMLKLAAYCGDQASQQALGQDVPEIPVDITARVRGLEWWSREIMVRAAYFAALSASQQKISVEVDLSSELASILNWLDCPCKDHLHTIRCVFEAAALNIIAKVGDGLFVTSIVAEAVVSLHTDQPPFYFQGTRQYVSDALFFAAQLSDIETVWQDISNGMISWALKDTTESAGSA